MAPALEAGSLNHWTAREVPININFRLCYEFLWEQWREGRGRVARKERAASVQACSPVLVKAAWRLAH